MRYCSLVEKKMLLRWGRKMDQILLKKVEWGDSWIQSVGVPKLNIPLYFPWKRRVHNWRSVASRGGGCTIIRGMHNWNACIIKWGSGVGLHWVPCKTSPLGNVVGRHIPRNQLGNQSTPPCGGRSHGRRWPWQTHCVRVFDKGGDGFGAKV